MFMQFLSKHLKQYEVILENTA